MHNSKLLLVVLMAVAMWVYLREMQKTPDQARSTPATEPRRSSAVEGQILEDKTFGSYDECDEATKAAVDDLQEKRVSAALASQSPLVESTVYMVYYRDARGQISCRGGRLVNEILADR